MPYAFPAASRGAGHGLRRRPVGRYAIYYRLRNDAVEIVRVVHAARDAGALDLDG